MSWADVLKKIKPLTVPRSSGKNSANPPTPGEHGEVLASLERLYNQSPTVAKPMIDKAAAEGSIYIGISVNSPGWSGENAAGGQFLNVNKAEISRSYYINKTGRLVGVSFDLAVAHELGHLVLPGSPDPDNATQAEMNAVKFDFDGDVIRKQQKAGTLYPFVDTCLAPRLLPRKRSAGLSF